MEYRMRGRLCLCILLIGVVLVGGSSAQRRNGYPTPPSPAVPADPTSQSPKATFSRLDTVALVREAKEMGALPARIPAEIEQVKKGLLPSSAIDKLKRSAELRKALLRH